MGSGESEDGNCVKDLGEGLKRHLACLREFFHNRLILMISDSYCHNPLVLLC